MNGLAPRRPSAWRPQPVLVTADEVIQCGVVAHAKIWKAGCVGRQLQRRPARSPRGHRDGRHRSRQRHRSHGDYAVAIKTKR